MRREMLFQVIHSCCPLINSVSPQTQLWSHQRNVLLLVINHLFQFQEDSEEPTHQRGWRKLLTPTDGCCAEFTELLSGWYCIQIKVHFIFLSELQDKQSVQSKQNFFCECTSSDQEKCNVTMLWYWWAVIITSGHVAPTMTTFVPVYSHLTHFWFTPLWAAELWLIQEFKEVQSCYMSLKDLQQPAVFSQNISRLRFSSLCELRNLCQTAPTPLSPPKEVGGIKYPYKEDSLFSYSGCSVQGKAETSEDRSTGNSS